MSKEVWEQNLYLDEVSIPEWQERDLRAAGTCHAPGTNS